MLGGEQFRAIVFNAARDNNLERMKVFLDEPRSEEWLNACLNDVCNEKIPLVIASRYGFLEIVKYLISKGAQASVRGTVSFDGEVISFAPPLWAAAAAGHLDIVRYLVEEAGADINQATATNSTPLRGACYDGHLDIVKFLVENGADMEIANRHGHTPLMIACFRGKSTVARYLLDKGADIQKQSHKGNTALHDAAEGDRADICRMLIEAGAQLKEDDTGLCPLMSSAMLGNERTMPLLMPICTSALKRRDAMKMLGCTLCDKKMNMTGALEAWLRAVKIPLSEEQWRQINESREKFEVSEVYCELKEVENEEDVLALSSQPELIHMMSLLMRERILGGGHQDVHYYIRFRGAVYCDLGRVERCFELWLHALRLQQKNLAPLHMSTVATFQAFADTYALAANEHRIHQELGRQNWPVETSQVMELYEMLCYEFERLEGWPDDEPIHDDCCDSHDHSIESEKERLLTAGLHLILLVHRLSYGTVAPDFDASRMLRICEKLELLPLHRALKEAETSDYITVNDEFPSPYVVEQLLKSGVDICAMDSMRNTPLHVLLHNEKPRESIVRMLLEAGAPLLARNAQNNTCLELMRLVKPKELDFPCGRYLTLMGLSANVVCRSEQTDLAFDVLPVDLHQFLSYH